MGDSDGLQACTLHDAGLVLGHHVGHSATPRRKNAISLTRPPSAIPYYTYLKRMKSPKSANCAGQFLEVGARKTEEVGATQIRKSIFASELVESSLLHTL